MEKFHENVSKELIKIGIISNFKVVKKINYKPKFVFSTCVFRLIDPYKDESIYMKGLMSMVSNFHNYFEKLSVRIYYDNSVLNKDNKWDKIFDILLMSEHVELIKYDFPQFRYNNVYHIGLLGTIMRMIPMFNFYNINEIIIVTDIDSYYDKRTGEPVREEIIDLRKKVEYLKQNKYDNMFKTYNLRKTIELDRLRMDDIYKDKLLFYIRFVMTPTIVLKKIDKSVFLDFIRCMHVKCDIYTNWIKEQLKYNKDTDKHKAIINELHSKHSSFFFGTDELFLAIITDYLISNRKSMYINFKFDNLIQYNYFLYEMYKNGIINKNYLEVMYNYILQNNDRNVDRNFNKLDSIYMNMVKQVKIRSKYLLDYSKLYDYRENKYLKRLYIFLCDSVKNNFLYNSIINKSNSNIYMKYFLPIILQDYETFLKNSREIYNIKEFVTQ